jgi:hypothetical protein
LQERGNKREWELMNAVLQQIAFLTANTRKKEDYGISPDDVL